MDAIANNAASESGTEQWIVCQLGAREHYVLPTELYRRGCLAVLCTDIWAGDGSLWKKTLDLSGALGRKLRDRYEPGLYGARVYSESPFTLGVQAIAGHFGRGHWDWDQIMRANRRFAGNAARNLERYGLLRPHDREKPIVFAYSYGALDILAAAKSAGCLAVLGQIDPGPEEDALIARLAQHHELGHTWTGPPQRYWDEWRRECALADVVIANSSWSASLLAKDGLPAEKIRIVPLAYGAEISENQPTRAYPEVFSANRPLRMLFLGQINLRKGVLELLAAMRRLSAEPVRLLMVGPVDPGLKSQFVLPANVEWAGPVSRSAVEEFYRNADLFILPTHSDGFAITQLEALARGLPVIASRHCGDVVLDGENGRLVDAVTTDAVEEQVRWALSHPKSLAEMSARAPARLAIYKPERVVDTLLAAVMGERK